MEFVSLGAVPLLASLTISLTTLAVSVRLLLNVGVDFVEAWVEADGVLTSVSPVPIEDNACRVMMTTGLVGKLRLGRYDG